MVRQSDASKEVRRRRVFYVPGFDPFPARRYREIYRREGAAQAATSGYDLMLTGSGTGWTVVAHMEGRAVRSRFDVLVWSDIVRDAMSRGLWASYAQMVRTAWIYASSGALWRLMGLRKGPVIAALFPVVVLLTQVAMAVAVMWTVATWGAAWWSWALGGVLGAAVLEAGRRYDNKIFAHYLMHDYAFCARWRGANAPELEARMRAFAEQVAEALEDDVEEVLVVGHSSGVHIAVSVLADLLRAGRVARTGPSLAFLSLGQVVPMVSFLPQAERLRADLAALSASDQVTWVDVTAPGDGCAFALCDPVAVSGVAPQGKRWPLVLSAAFTQTLSPERWRALRWRFFRLHFQYLCAFDRPGVYDYFKITAGPKTLRARFEGRTSSRSRIERPVSGHTSQAA